MEKNELLSAILANKRLSKQIIESIVGLDKVIEQLELYHKGLPFVKLVKPATINDGIISVPETDFLKYIFQHNKHVKDGRYMKFIPASGAASRMFKALNSFITEHPASDYWFLKEKSKSCKNAKDTLDFIDNIEKFAFFDELSEIMKKNGFDLAKERKNGNISSIIRHTIGKTGLELSNLPKGLIPFHKFQKSPRTPFYEHLIEAACYTKASNDKTKLHFTLTDRHIDNVNNYLKSIIETDELLSSINIELSFSTQNPATDIIAANPDNSPFQDNDGNVVFRPGGHGALLENINKLDADVIFIKNIDNVAPDSLKDVTYLYKRILGGFFAETEEKIHTFLRKAVNGSTEKEDLDQISEFTKTVLFKQLPTDFQVFSIENQIDYFFDLLNRPLRVCGMVKNQGEPGGGPFFVEERDGSVTLQIVESAQIDPNDPSQLEILSKSTHFNPVDLVCGIRDYKGDKFNLFDYSDPETAFIVRKTRFGRDYKAIELPGLWNGSMAKWNTIFIETPITTFSPVKTVNDLLREEHLF